AEANASRTRNVTNGNLLLNSITSNATTVFRDNAYLNPTTLAAMVNANVQSFTMERIWSDVGTMEGVEAVNQSRRVVGGVRGNFTDDWTYSAAVQYSFTGVYGDYTRTMDWVHLFAAADAVRDPASGKIVCRVTLTKPGFLPGCVPINLMGAGNVTP